MVDIIRPILPKKFRDKPVVIPTVRLSGAIMASQGMRPTLSIATAAGRLKKAFSVKEAPAVAIVINSPGGSPVQANLIYKRIRALAEENDKKVIVAVEDVAASGGYMIALAGDEIIADPSSIVGSIGVISAGFGYVDLLEKLGVERRVYTAGTNKMILDPFQPEKKSDIQYLRSIQNEIHDTFVDMVKDRRGDVISGDEKEVFSGRFWTATTGQSLGLVDRIGDIRSIVKERYGEKTQLKVIGAGGGLFKRAPSNGVTMPNDMSAIGAGFAEHMVTQAEERALWARYGL
ncbi:MAG: S49 family peptidase [Hyphomicrobiales bacterium]